MKIPMQSPQVYRQLFSTEGRGSVSEVGAEAAQSVCDDLTGMAQQICYAVEYNVSI